MNESPVSTLGLTHPAAEIAVLDAMRRDSGKATELMQRLTAEDFHDPRRSIIFESIANLVRGIEPIDDAAILAESRRVCKVRDVQYHIDENYLRTLSGEWRRASMYANVVQRMAWLRQAGEFAYWLVQELQMNPQVDDLFTEAQERWQHLRPAKSDSRFHYGWETLSDHEKITRKRIQEYEAGTASRFDWPWRSWNNYNKVRPLRPGFVGILAAPDGMGKTTYLEMIAEHWAQSGQHVVYVHLEDAYEYKLDRRLARHALVPMSAIEDGNLTQEHRDKIIEAHKRIDEWAGCLHYYHAAGESMPNIVRELETRIAEGVCNAVVFDYLDKVQPTRGQSDLFGTNTWERQAHDMEALKTFAEQNNVPVYTATQGNKSMQGSGTQTRQAIQGSGQKSQKSQLVMILTRDIVGSEGLRDKSGTLLAEEGEYSPICKIRIDKQNRGKTGNLSQVIVGQYFTVRDMQA